MNIENEVMSLIKNVEQLKMQVSILWKINLGAILTMVGLIVKDVMGLLKCKDGGKNG